MQTVIFKIRGLGYIVWHARHLMYHIVFGILWALALREVWGTMNTYWMFLSIIGSLLPDTDHIVYFMTYGKRASYTQDIFSLIRSKQWRNLAVFIEKGHKNNTSLSTHNIYIVGILVFVTYSANMWQMRAITVLTGSMLIHYVFDIFDDLMLLGGLNPNWFRWGREKRRHSRSR